MNRKQRLIKIRRAKPLPKARPAYFVMDEFHFLAQSTEYQHLAGEFLRAHPRKISYQTQAVIRSNSGKRLRFIGQSFREDGSPWKAMPKKHVPAQVLRRAVGQR